MAKPIRNTPILYGKDAERFQSEISILPPTEERVAERARIQQSVRSFLDLIESRKALSAK